MKDPPPKGARANATSEAGAAETEVAPEGRYLGQREVVNVELDDELQRVGVHELVGIINLVIDIEGTRYKLIGCNLTSRTRRA